MKLNKKKIALLKKVASRQIGMKEIEEDHLLKKIISKQELVMYSQRFSQRTGQYYISNLQLTEKGKSELMLALRTNRKNEKRPLKLIIFTEGILLGVIFSFFLLG
ncbi:hypothetical protein [Ligilactobacillus pobuzihii]|uniref:Uncharacterized protein n=1 Tax=Ligilactobacillus pobuzihii TaxID=449659 RepID=A0A0R2L1P2_9LACO|nr:hypothetical protein [Ligilactobacillus pobuzihii]KRK09982.1 hypothetical protein FD11_GL000394 [Ligilactobacillus pobuzihii E100301 = KCTC 13174]KRN95598.1 hypothetical protein IV66_GL001042 [Ligilactobacillus pobuzihii]GEN47983.1 hypothetical protein LPO01_07750 [Ligilactobacillus pobuzihii]